MGLLLGVGSVSADTVTFTAGTDKGETSVTKNGITVSMSTMSRDDNYRVYANTDMTVSSSVGNITSIAITCTASETSNYGPGKLSGIGYTYSGTTGTWTGKAILVTLSASAQARITEIVVTYETAQPVDPSAPGGENNPYTVAQAIENTPSNGNVYIRGIVSSFYGESIMDDNTNYRYYISDDGTTTTELLVYKGKGLNGAAFSDANDLYVGDEVVICGSLITFNDAPEVNSGNYIVSLTRATHNVTFSINGTTQTGEVAEHASIPFPENPADIEGKTFVGWTTAPINGTQATAPTLVTSATMGTADVTYYAVFANAAETVGEVTSTYGFETESDSEWNVSEAIARTEEQGNTGSYAGRINSNNTYITFNEKVKVTEFSFAFKRTSSNSNYNVYIETSSDNTTWTAAETYPMSAFGNGSYTTKTKTFDGNTELYVRFHCYNTTAIRYVDDVTIKYNAVTTTYSDYCTTVTPTTATITLNAACTDGDMVYGTYSNTSAFVVSDDIVVSEVGIVDGKLLIEEYETGAVVPANTGVMVSALEGGDYTVTLTDAQGESVLGDDNCLRPSGEGITAEGMAQAAANCKYYRLTMQGGTQIGFWWGAADGAAFALAANKAYLAVPTSVGGSRTGFTFAGNETGIESVNTVSTADSYFDLQGRRVMQPTRGLYIVNGKKVVLK